MGGEHLAKGRHAACGRIVPQEMPAARNTEDRRLRPEAAPSRQRPGTKRDVVLRPDRRRVFGAPRQVGPACSQLVARRRIVSREDRQRRHAVHGPGPGSPQYQRGDAPCVHHHTQTDGTAPVLGNQARVTHVQNVQHGTKDPRVSGERLLQLPAHRIGEGRECRESSVGQLLRNTHNLVPVKRRSTVTAPCAWATTTEAAGRGRGRSGHREEEPPCGAVRRWARHALNARHPARGWVSWR